MVTGARPPPGQSSWPGESTHRGRPSHCRQQPSLPRGPRGLLWHSPGAPPRTLPHSTGKPPPANGPPQRGPQGHHSLILGCCGASHTFLSHMGWLLGWKRNGTTGRGDKVLHLSPPGAGSEGSACACTDLAGWH